MIEFFKILFHPKNFFSRDAQKIRGYKRPVMYFIVLAIIFTFATTYQQVHHADKLMTPIYDFLGMSPETPPITTPVFISLYLSTLISFLLTASLRYYLTHLFTRFFNKKADFESTYKAMSFSTTHGWIGTLLFVFFTGLLLWWQLSWWWWLLLIITGLGFLALEIYSVYIRSFALSQAHKLKWWQAFVVIYLLAQTMYLFLAIIISLIIGAIVFGIAHIGLSLT